MLEFLELRLCVSDPESPGRFFLGGRTGLFGVLTLARLFGLLTVAGLMGLFRLFGLV